MIKLFFKNAFRSTIMMLIAGIVGSILGLIILTLGIELLQIKAQYQSISCITYFVFGGISGGLASFVMLLVPALKEWELIYDGYSYRTMHIVCPIILLLLNLIVAVLAILVMIFMQNRLNLFIQNYEAGFFICLFIPVIAVFYIMYFIAFCKHYLGGDVSCWKCRHSFCIKKEHLSTERESGTKFITKKEHLEFGTVKYDGKETKIYGDVPIGYYRDYITTTNNFICICEICGAKHTTSSIDTNYTDRK